MRRHQLIPLAVALAGCISLPESAAANVCAERWKEGRAVHAELQRKAIDELDAKDYPAACKTMQELTRLARDMRAFNQRHCWTNEEGKRMYARADTIADRTREICEQAGKR